MAALGGAFKLSANAEVAPWSTAGFLRAADNADVMTPGKKHSRLTYSQCLSQLIIKADSLESVLIVGLSVAQEGKRQRHTRALETTWESGDSIRMLPWNQG